MAKPFIEKNGKTWAVRPSYTLPNGRYTSKYLGGFATKREAQLAEGDFIMNLNGDIKDMRFFALCDFFIETKTAAKRSSKTIKSYNDYIPLLKEELGNIVINQVTTAMMQVIINKHSALPGKCAHIISTASAIFTFAFDQDLIEKNPMAKVTKPAQAIKHIPHYNKEQQLRQLLQFIKGKSLQYYVPAFLTSLYGLRPSEVVAVEESDIDKINWTMKINKTYDEIKKEIIPTTKTKKSTAILPINQTIYNELQVFKKANNISSKYICCDAQGNFLKPIGLYRFMRRLFGKTQKSEEARQTRQEEVGCEYITPYGFRHSFSNINKSRKENTFTISSIMRHDTPLTTQEHYFHADDEQNRALINSFSETILKPETA